MNPPRLTVLMSVHNGGRWLRAAIDSVLAQTWGDYEFLILDDASTDDSVAQIEAVRDERIRLIRLPENVGLTRSLNCGLHAARGEIIARQDSDDLSERERLARQVAFLDRHPTVAVVGTQARLIDAEGKSRGDRDLPLEAASVRWLSLLDNPVIHTAATFRTKLIREDLGGYDETFPCCQDYDLWTRVMARREVRNLRERLVRVREHGASISATRRMEAATMVERVVRRLAPAFSDREVALACAFRRHLAPEEVSPFHEMLARWDALQIPADAVGQADLALTRALVMVRIGYNLLTQDRRLAWRQIAEAMRIFPDVKRSIPWLRVIALLVLGERARRLTGRVPAR
ncbi:MAG: glycosyltransferase [Chthoniobacteraceae bacterium]